MNNLEVRENLTDEQNLILLCSSTRASPEQRMEISKLLDNELDWEFLLNTASVNGLLPLMCWTLLRNFPDELPDDIKPRLDNFLKKHTQHNLILTLKLIEIVQGLEKIGIPALPFKGTTLAHRAYGNLALRQYVDLDLLVQPKHFHKAVDFLIELGFNPHGDGSRAKRRTPGFSRRKDIGLSNKDKNIHVELHWKISGSHFGLPVEIHRLWDRLETINLGGSTLNSLSFQDLFVYLCLHGSRHGWEKLAWLFDLKELIQTREASGQAVDWIEIRDIAREYGCEKVVELAIYLLDVLLDYKIDFPGFEQIADQEMFQRIADSVLNNTLSRDSKSKEIGDWYYYHLSLKERKIDRMRLHSYYILWYMRLVFAPNAMDKAIFSLPKVFYPLYFVLRPFRLLYIHFFSPGKDTVE